VPWEKDANSGSGSASPDILTIQSNPVSARETRETLEDVGVGTQDDGMQADSQEEDEQQLQLDEGMQTEDDPMCRAQSGTSKSAKQLPQLGKPAALCTAACHDCWNTLCERHQAASDSVTPCRV
jgi:hypothetical protein